MPEENKCIKLYNLLLIILKTYSSQCLINNSIEHFFFKF